MGQRKPLSRTAQRGYLYLSLVVAIVLLLVCWPAPKGDEPIAAVQPTACDSVAEQTQSAAKASRPEKKPANGQRRHAASQGQRPNAKRDYGPDHHPAQTQAASGSVWTQSTPAPKRKPLMVDLNEADTLTLQLLYGIGPVYAKRIVKYRERLGGFVSANQLLEVYGITPELLAQLTPHLTLTSDGIRRIAINSVTLKQLIRHPYIEYYQARDLIAWRNQGHRYNSIDDLRLVSSMDDSTLARLSPYLSFE